MSSDIAWEWYRSFLEVARAGSLSAAARSLGITQPTVGRHIAALEQQLGQPLFVRAATGLQLTEQGCRLQPYAESMDSTMAALERAAQGHAQAVAGTVRISASELLAVEVLPSILQPLRQSHPGLQLELVATDKVEDLLHRASDIAVRMLRPTQEALIAQHLGQVELGLYAHPNYLEKHGEPQSWDELLQGRHALIGFDQTTPVVRSLQQRWPQLQRSTLAYRSDSAAACMALLRAGAGIGLCQVPLAQQTPTLQRVLPEAMGWQLEMWLAMHEDLRVSPVCHTVFQALAQGLRRYLTAKT